MLPIILGNQIMVFCCHQDSPVTMASAELKLNGMVPTNWTRQRGRQPNQRQCWTVPSRASATSPFRASSRCRQAAVVKNIEPEKKTLPTTSPSCRYTGNAPDQFAASAPTRK